MCRVPFGKATGQRVRFHNTPLSAPGLSTPVMPGCSFHFTTGQGFPFCFTTGQRFWLQRARYTDFLLQEMGDIPGLISEDNRPEVSVFLHNWPKGSVLQLTLPPVHPSIRRCPGVPIRFATGQRPTFRFATGQRVRFWRARFACLFSRELP